MAVATKNNVQDENQILEGLLGVFKIGKCYFIRTVTYHTVGRVTGIHNVGPTTFVELEDATQIVEVGNNFEQVLLDKAKPRLMDYLGKSMINVAAVTDFMPWGNALPTRNDTKRPA